MVKLLTIKQDLNELNLSLYQPKKDQCDTCCSYEAGNMDEETYQEHLSSRAWGFAMARHRMCSSFVL